MANRFQVKLNVLMIIYLAAMAVGCSGNQSMFLMCKQWDTKAAVAAAAAAMVAAEEAVARGSNMPLFRQHCDSIFRPNSFGCSVNICMTNPDKATTNCCWVVLTNPPFMCIRWTRWNMFAVWILKLGHGVMDITHDVIHLLFTDKQRRPTQMKIHEWDF